MVVGRWGVGGGRWSLVAGRWSLVAGRWWLVAGGWARVAGGGSRGAGRWWLVACRWALVAGGWDVGRGGWPIDFWVGVTALHSRSRRRLFEGRLCHIGHARHDDSCGPGFCAEGGEEAGEDVGEGAGAAFQPGVDAGDDGGVEADAGHEEEIASVGDAEVDAAAVALEDDTDGLCGIFRDAGFVGPDVGGAAGDDGEGGVGAGEAVDDLVDGAIAAVGDDDVGVVGGGFARELGRLAGVASGGDGDGPASVAEDFNRGFEAGGLRLAAGGRVTDDGAPFHGARLPGVSAESDCGGRWGAHSRGGCATHHSRDANRWTGVWRVSAMQSRSGDTTGVGSYTALRHIITLHSRGRLCSISRRRAGSCCQLTRTRAG